MFSERRPLWIINRGRQTSGLRSSFHRKPFGTLLILSACRKFPRNSETLKLGPFLVIDDRAKGTTRALFKTSATRKIDSDYNKGNQSVAIIFPSILCGSSFTNSEPLSQILLYIRVESVSFSYQACFQTRKLNFSAFWKRKIYWLQV